MKALSWRWCVTLLTLVFLDPDYSQDSRLAGSKSAVSVLSSLQPHRDTNCQEMKPDLITSLNVSGDMSPLPFSMPKLDRKLAELSRPPVSLSIASKQARPLSLHTPTTITSLRLPLQASGQNYIFNS